MSQQREPLHAIIGVRYRASSTFYVKRSFEMANYPGVWSLFSIQYRPSDLPDPTIVGGAVDALFRKMSDERLGGVPIKVERYLTSGSSDDNPMNLDVHLHLYEIELPNEPILNPRYYIDSDWLSPEEYEDRCAEQVCGLCLRLWADYAWLAGITEHPFILPAHRT